MHWMLSFFLHSSNCKTNFHPARNRKSSLSLMAKLWIADVDALVEVILRAQQNIVPLCKLLQNAPIDMRALQWSSCPSHSSSLISLCAQLCWKNFPWKIQNFHLDKSRLSLIYQLLADANSKIQNRRKIRNFSLAARQKNRSSSQ